jgi:ADP-heptose:LPS heptosyltransferase
MRRLLIRPGALGDCILSFPALEYLKADYTEVWVPSPVVPLIRFADTVRSIASTGIDLLGITEQEVPHVLRGFDSIMSWYGSNRPEFRELLPDVEFHAALPPVDFSGHATDFFAEQVGAPKGLRPCIEAHGMLRDSVVIHPFSGSSRKNWPLACYRELAAQLNCPVEWTAGPDEVLPEAMRFDNVAELASWLRGARLYIGNDSGVTHLAAAVGVPTIAIFLRTRAEMWAPRGASVTVLQNPSIDEVVDVANQRRGLPQLAASSGQWAGAQQ